MDSLMINLEGTKTTPTVLIDGKSRCIEFKGRSAPKASLDFYMPLKDRIVQLLKSNNGSVTANFAFEYFNTSSAKCLFEIMKVLAGPGLSPTINWHYDEYDEDMREVGEDYEDALGLEFNYIEIS